MGFTLVPALYTNHNLAKILPSLIHKMDQNKTLDPLLLALPPLQLKAHLPSVLLALACLSDLILIENAQRHFQGPLLGCFEYVPYTALTIVLIIKTINVKLD